MNMDQIVIDLKSRLKPSRFDHTLRVVEIAVKLAKIHGVNQEDAKVAALLHDYSKYDTDEEILKVLKENHIEIDSVVKAKPNLAHGLVAALKLKVIFPSLKKEVLNAIASHTFGHTDMTTLEKVIYLADALEEGRTYPGVDKLRTLAYDNINEAMIAVSGHTMTYEINKGHMIHTDTVKMRNALLEAN